MTTIRFKQEPDPHTEAPQFPGGNCDSPITEPDSKLGIFRTTSTRSRSASLDDDCVSIIDCQIVNGNLDNLSKPENIKTDPEYYFDEESGQIIHFIPSNDPDSETTGTAETFTIRFVPDGSVSQTDADTDVDAADEAIHVKVYKCSRCNAQFERSYQLKRHIFVDHSQSGSTVKEQIRTTQSTLSLSSTSPTKQPPQSFADIKPTSGRPQPGATTVPPVSQRPAVPPLTIPVLMLLPPATHPIKITQRSQHDADHIGYLRRTRPGDDLYQCKLCSATSNSLDAVDAHLLLHNGTPFAYHCELCDDPLASLALLQNHVHAHTCVGWTHYCARCELRFEGPAALRMHGCLGKATPMCLQCRQTFVSFSLSTAHQHLHTGRRHYRCDVCNLAFIHRAALAMHRQVECVGLR